MWMVVLEHSICIVFKTLQRLARVPGRCEKQEKIKPKRIRGLG